MRKQDLTNFIVKICSAAVLLAASLLFLPGIVPAAYAADALTVQVCLDGQIATVGSYSQKQLAALGSVCQCYSSVDANSAPMGIVAEGVPLTALLADLGIALSDAESLRFTASDGGSRSYSMASYVTATRYYYGQIVDGYDGEAAQLPAFTAGAEQQKTAVSAILAWRSYEGRYQASPDQSLLSDSDGLRFCFGQSAITETVVLNYGKKINTMIVTLKSGSAYQMPEQGQTPEDTPDGENGAQQTGGAVTVPSTGLAEALDTQGLKADSLTITVGYFGGSYYTKKVFSMEDLAAMADVKQIYSYIDNMPAVCLDAAVGVRITDILAAAGIDVNSVQSFHFYCADVSRTWYTTMSKTYLLDMPRYYYPKLPQSWDYDEAQALSGATAGAVQVDAILAVQDKWRRMATEIDFRDLTDTTRCRLVFGQSDVYTVEGSRSAKWVHTLAVALGGAPPKGVTLDVSALELLVGSAYQVTASVEKTDQTTDTRVTWSSSDESIVKVNSDGTVTVLAPGQATVTATTVSGGLTASVTINGSESPVEEAATPPAENGGAAGVYRITLGQKGSTGVTDAAVQNWRNSQMAENAVALPQLAEDNPLMQTTLLFLAVLFAVGVIGRILIYRLEV